MIPVPKTSDAAANEIIKQNESVNEEYNAILQQALDEHEAEAEQEMQEEVRNSPIKVEDRAAAYDADQEDATR